MAGEIETKIRYLSLNSCDAGIVLVHGIKREGQAWNMVETRDLEVISIEIEQITQEFLVEFVKSSFEYLLLLSRGGYAGIVSTGILAANGKWMTDKLILDSNVFWNARKYFEIEENRGKLLALTDENNKLLTFLVWNQRSERTSEYVDIQKSKLLQLLKAGEKIELKNWDEYTDEYYQFLVKHCDKKNIILSGRNWELGPDGKNPGVNAEMAGKDKNIVADKNGIQYPAEEFQVDFLIEGNQEFEHKNWYLWLDCAFPSACTLLAEMVLEYGYVPDGICELRNQREIDRLWGFDVIDAENAAQQKESIIIVGKEKEKEFLKEFIPGEKIVVYNELFRNKVSFMQKGLFQTWGTKRELWRFRNDKLGISIKLPYQNRECQDDASGVLLWEYRSCKSSDGYKKYISTINKKVPLYVNKRGYEAPGGSSRMLKTKIFDKILEEKRRCILYGVQSHYTSDWIQLLERFQIEYEIMEDEEIENWYGYRVSSIYDLPYYYDDVEDICVIVNKPYDEFDRAIELLSDYGITIDEENCISIYEMLDNLKRGNWRSDLCIGQITEQLAESQYPGYCVLGDDMADDYKIMVLGGSTSDATLYNCKSWPEILQQLCKSNGKKVTIYDGAAAGYWSMQELAKTIRDAGILKPDMIISFSGTNDTGEIFEGCWVGYVNGVVGDNNENNFERWLENEKMMNEFAARIGAKFYCFAQPQQDQNEKLGKYGKLFTREMRRYCNFNQEWKKCVKTVTGHPWMIDLTDILDEFPDVYFDTCHVKTEGNTIIAEHIYEHIEKEIK